MMADPEVSDYSGDPLKGGRLIGTAKLTPPPQTAPPDKGRRRTSARIPSRPEHLKTPPSRFSRTPGVEHASSIWPRWTGG